ncbi:MAG: hypothetical protein AAFQ41_02305 [Cyanobacteria bacterium J06623_7]
MTISTTDKLTVEHIKFATPTQLGKLLKKSPNTVSRWNRRGLKTTDLKIAFPCVERDVLITGLIHRKENFSKIEELQKEFDEILNSVQEIPENTAVA